MIKYVIGDATKPIGDGVKIIAHVCNNQGGWGKGFVLAISNRWKTPEIEYRKWATYNDFGLGVVQTVEVEPNLYIANMIAQNGYKSRFNPQPIQYQELEKCLFFLNAWAKTCKATIHMPKIGTGLAGGDWELIEPIIRKNIVDVDVYIYDLKK